MMGINRNELLSKVPFLNRLGRSKWCQALIDRLRLREACLLTIFVGLCISHFSGQTLLGLVVSGIGVGGLWLAGSRAAKVVTRDTKPEPRAATPEPPRIKDRRRRSPREARGSDELIVQMLEQGRHALLLRPQLYGNLSDAQRLLARETLDEAMALVPEGEVLMESLRRFNQQAEDLGPRGQLVHVEAALLDRYPITNEMFQEFVDDNGYGQMSLWEPTIWPAVLNFTDQTGQLGPRYWQKGRHAAGQADHPVVGISWFEAVAYARWAGKRLPDDAEWVKAAAWPINASQSLPVQRRYPWGDTMQRGCGNLWGSGHETTVSVHEFPKGATVGGIYQMIGNVWEWTQTDFGAWDLTQKPEAETPMKSIRGGAYDTYFDHQATCQFQSGESPLSRKHNIGFRCAVSVAEVAAAFTEQNSDPDNPVEIEEVLV